MLFSIRLSRDLLISMKVGRFFASMFQQFIINSKLDIIIKSKELHVLCDKWEPKLKVMTIYNVHAIVNDCDI